MDPALIDATAKYNTIYREAKNIEDVDLSISKELLDVLENTNNFLYEGKLISGKADIKSSLNPAILKKAENKIRTIKNNLPPLVINDAELTKPFSH